MQRGGEDEKETGRQKGMTVCAGAEVSLLLLILKLPQSILSIQINNRKKTRQTEQGVWGL